MPINIPSVHSPSSGAPVPPTLPLPLVAFPPGVRLAPPGDAAPGHDGRGQQAALARPRQGLLVLVVELEV